MQENKGRKRLFIIIGSIIMLVIVAILVLPGLRNDESQAAVVEETADAFIGDLSASATASGQVFPSRQATLSADQMGRVESVLVNIGDRVQEGDILVQLDTADLALDLASTYHRAPRCLWRRNSSAPPCPRRARPALFPPTLPTSS